MLKHKELKFVRFSQQNTRVMLFRWGLRVNCHAPQVLGLFRVLDSAHLLTLREVFDFYFILNAIKHLIKLRFGL